LMCDRTIEVVNGATEAYTLADNIERLRRDIVPLRPDLLISYHGYNGLSGLFGSAAFSDAGHPPRRELGPSPILTEIAYRARLAIFQFELNRRQVRPIYTEDQVMKSKYADSYRRLIQIAHDHSFGVVLSSSSMAVNGSSPREVKNFYGSVFQNIDETIIRNQAHNEIVKKLAETEKVPFIDTAPQLDGFWDNDFYYDLVHFTQAGTKRMAQTMFDGLSGVLRNDPRLRCTETRKSGVVTK
jgi:lysophospholipase L1-like esterase